VQNPPSGPTDPLPPEPLPKTTPPAGNPPPEPPAGPAPADLAPAVSGLKLSRASFRKGKGTTIGFRLNEAAQVKLSFERKLAGRRVRGRCVKPPAGRRANCTRYLRVRTRLSLSGKAGANAVVLRARSLPAGRYRLTLVATDATGKHSVPARTSFRLLASVSEARAKSALTAVRSWL
jgi:hypothetical protein